MKHIRILAILFFTCHLSIAQTFPLVSWQFYTGAPSFGSASAADLDKDGKLEIVFSTYTNDGRVHCLNAEDGTENWSYNIGGCGDAASLIYDVNNDDTLDVIIDGSCNPTIFCFNGATGALEWSVPSGGGDSPPTVADVDNDGRPEILFGNFEGQVRILNGEDGSTAKIINVDPNADPIETAPTIADVNGDGIPDFIVANYDNIDGLYVKAYDYGTADTIWTNYVNDTSSAFNAYHGGAVADIDNDGKLEYVIGSNDGYIRALNIENGSLLWSYNASSSVMSPISIADLNHDDTMDVVFTNSNEIGVLNGMTGMLEWSYPTIFSSFRGCAIADINNDGILDLVSGHYMGNVIAVEPFSGLLWKINLMQYFPNSASLPWFDVDHGPLIGDFNNDDTMEVFVVAGYGTYTPDSLNTGKAFMLKAGIGNCPQWLMFRHDVHRTAFLSPTEVSACDSVNSIQKYTVNNENALLYPNPFSSFIDISFYLSSPSAVLLKIYNMNGQLIKQNNYKYNTKGEHVIGWNVPTWCSNGIYFYILNTTDKTFSGKMVLER